MYTAVIFSIVFILLTVALAFRVRNNPNIKIMYIIIAGAAVSVFVMMLYINFSAMPGAEWTALMLSFLHTIQVMLTGYNFADLPIAWTGFPLFYIGMLFVLAPICTFGFVLSFFENLSSYIRLFWTQKKDIYIMSEISAKSIVLARSIKEKYPKSTVAFMNVFSKDEDTYDLIKDSAGTNAIFFKLNITDLSLRLHSQKAKTVFFAIDENESCNIETALSLIEQYRSRENTELYVFSSSSEGGLLLDAIDDGCMKVRRINENHALAYSVICNKDDLITKHHTVSNGKKKISALVVGFGGYGTEITKALLWCCQLPSYDLEINVIDKRKDTEAVFAAKCPEIVELNNNRDPGDARYSLNFHEETDVTTSNFNDTVSSLKDTSIVFVSLGNDELNIETAIQIRILLERVGSYPTIRAVVHSDVKADILASRGLINYQNQPYDIETLGSLKARYSYSSIINEELEALALKHHLAWANTPEAIIADTKRFNEIEYFRNSSAASAIHDMYRESEGLDEAAAVITEHIRWNAYMRTEGYVFSGSNDKKTRNDRAKMHHDLVKQKVLDDGEVDKDRRMIKASK